SFSHTCFHVAPYESYIALAERLNVSTPGDFAKKTMLVTTGAEAVENAVKMARAFTGRSGVIAFSGAFHGRTLLGMALCGKVNPYKKSFGAMPAEVMHAPFPNEFHGVSIAESLSVLENMLRSSIDPERVAAIIVEPVQGEGGFVAAPTEFLQALRKICDTHGMMLIADEVQTGMGRTGKLFAFEHAGVAADLVCMAKGLAGGFPLSAVSGRAEVV
ncbi:4-aminobutyrate aminotransferase, partial [Marinosulfonomonas sp. PRT-SC04]